MSETQVLMSVSNFLGFSSWGQGFFLSGEKPWRGTSFNGVVFKKKLWDGWGGTTHAPSLWETLHIAMYLYNFDISRVTLK